MLKYFGIFSLLFILASPGLSNECRIEAEAVVGILDFEISGCSVVGKLLDDGKGLSGEFKVNLKKLDTGLQLRTEHMRNKYLEVSKYPFTKLKLEQVPYGGGTFKGTLTLHGVSRPVSGRVSRCQPGKLQANFSIKITDFGIQKPGYKGIVIGEKINIFVNLNS